MDAKELGRAGEQIAAKLLSLKGFVILETNFVCPLGEVDIIADRGGTRYCVEVKARSSAQFGRPVEAVGGGKQQRLRRLAEYYMVANRYRGPIAFGVIGVIHHPLERRFSAHLIEHAF